METENIVPEEMSVSDLSVYHSPSTLGKACPPATLQEAAVIAKAIVAARVFKGKVTTEAEALLKIQKGREMGVGPIASLSSFYFLDREKMDSTIAMSSQLMAALVKNSYDHRYIVDKAEDTICVLIWQQKMDGKWEDLGKSCFTIDDAKRAGVYKSKGAWEKYPEEMCFWRALAKGFRRFTPHLAMGATVYTKEEIDDIGPDVEDAEFSVKEKLAEQSEKMNG